MNSEEKPPFDPNITSSAEPVQRVDNEPTDLYEKPPFDPHLPSTTDRGESESTLGQVKTAAEQFASGATLGASKVLETKGIPALGIPPLTTPEAVRAREEANPGIATLGNIAGTGATLLGTGGLGAAAKGLGLAARVGLAAAESGIIGGVNQATDDWSQNKPLDAQKIAATAGTSALLGPLLGETLAATKYQLGTPLAYVGKKASKLVTHYTPLGLVVKGIKLLTPEEVKTGLTDLLASTNQAFQKQVQKYDTQLNDGIRLIFKSGASENNKKQ